jgi:hypothetical protein
MPARLMRASMRESTAAPMRVRKTLERQTGAL